MDPHHYRDSVRSPGDRDRGWSSRDDRLKDERGDRDRDYYRSRSPGTERSRRRSRSPVAVDRYEPRGRGRDDYAAPRDRDDRRRIGSPPANIDRYVPGQDPLPPPPLTNPIPDPLKLPYQVGFSYFGEWWRANERIKEEKERLRTGRRREPERVRTQEDREKEKAKIQAAYDAYKEELQAKMAQSFVKQHKEDQWFRERYVPEVRDALRQKLNEMRREAYARWEQDLASGVFDDFTLEGIPKNESNGAGGVVEKEEGETTAANEVLGVGDLVPANPNEIRDESLYQPTLLIKTIAPSVSRQNLENFCKEHLGEGEGGFKWLSLSDPNPSKRFHRIGWIILNPASEPPAEADPEEAGKDEQEDGESKPKPRTIAEKALEAINGKTVKDEQRGDFTCHVGVHNPPANPRKKALWDLFSHPDRIRKDLQLATELVNKYESDFGSDFNAVLQIEEYVEKLRSEGKLEPAVPTSPVKKTKKERIVDSTDDALDKEVEEGDASIVGGEDEDEDEGVVDDEVDDIDLLVTKKKLDLTIEYLRRVFNFCFFCVFESDSVHELTRKCPGGHLRRPRSTLSSAAKIVAQASAAGEPFPSRKRKESEEVEEGEATEPEQRKFRASSKTEQQLQRAYNWVKTFEDKINQILHPESVDIRKLGGKPVEDAVHDELSKYVKQEDEHKWRCKIPECTKLFKEEHFWRKHVEKRHTEWLDKLKEEFELINAYVLDPAHIAPSRTDANSNGHFPQPNGQQPTGTPRGFNLQNYAMNNMINFAGFPMSMFQQNMLGGANPLGSQAWHHAGAASAGGSGGHDDRGGGGPAGPIRRGGPAGGAGSSGRYNSRVGPYDRRGGRWGGGEAGGMNGGGGRGGRGGGGFSNRWGDGVAGGGAMAPREAVQGRTIKSYEDLDQVSGGGGGELNY